MSSLAFRCDLAQVSHCDADKQCFLDNKQGLHLYMFLKVTGRKIDTHERERYIEEYGGYEGKGHESFLL